MLGQGCNWANYSGQPSCARWRGGGWGEGGGGRAEGSGGRGGMGDVGGGGANEITDRNKMGLNIHRNHKAY